MLIDRLGDQHLGLRTRTQDWSWDEVVRESAARGSLAKSLRAPGPFHIGVLLENDPEFLFWLGGAALSRPRSSASIRPGVELNSRLRSGTSTAS